MQPTRYTTIVDGLRMAYTADAAIEYRLRIFAPLDGEEPLVIIYTNERPADAGFAAALAYELLGEVSHPGPWIWLHEQSSARRRDAPPHDELLRLLVLVRDSSGLPVPYTPAWTPTNRAWIEQLLGQPLGPPDRVSRFKVQVSNFPVQPGTCVIPSRVC